MRITTFLWGLLVTAVGVLAVLRGGGIELSPTVIVVSLLLLFALGFAVAALLPSRKHVPDDDGDADGFVAEEPPSNVTNFEDWEHE